MKSANSTSLLYLTNKADLRILVADLLNIHTFYFYVCSLVGLGIRDSKEHGVKSMDA